MGHMRKGCPDHGLENAIRDRALPKTPDVLFRDFLQRNLKTSFHFQQIRIFHDLKIFFN